jgi:phospho-N-acetylmuramoyl-pentapeptide-transferase
MSTNAIPFDGLTLTAALVPLAVSLLAGGPYIKWLQSKMMGQYIREDGPQSHLAKAGTPTAGGLLILASVLVGVIAITVMKGRSFLFAPVGTVLVVLLVFGALGFSDDALKIFKKKNKGVTGYTKLAVQVLTGLLAGWMSMRDNPGGIISLFGLAEIPLGLAYPLFSAFVITGASNSVNLTDGLDGLAAGTAVMTFMTFSLFLFLTHSIDLALLAQMLAAACVGFLFFNRHPARVFMGDTGSLALGGAMGAMAVAGHLELWLIFLAILYIMETLSVILQVASFKTTGKRIFRMSPLHHHFELGGWSELRVVYTFISIQFAGCALAVLLYNQVIPN